MTKSTTKPGDDAGAGLYILDPLLRDSTSDIILRCGKIKPGPKTLYLYILSYAKRGRVSPARAWPGQARIAKELGVTRKSITRWLKVLGDMALLSWKRQGFSQHYVYYVEPLPAWLVEEFLQMDELVIRDNLSQMDSAVIRDNLSQMEESPIRDNLSQMEGAVIRDNLSHENGPKTPIRDKLSHHMGQFYAGEVEEEEEYTSIRDISSSSSKPADVDDSDRKQPPMAEIIELDRFLRAQGIYRAEQIAINLLKRYSLPEAKAFALAHEMDLDESDHSAEDRRRLLAWRVRHPDDAPPPEALLEEAGERIAVGKEYPPTEEEKKRAKYVGKYADIIEH